MGCRISKPNEATGPVLLCRDRRDLIRTAANQRRVLTSAHVAYFQSLSRVGDALVEFVQQDVVSIDSMSSSSVLTLPPSPNGKKPETDLDIKPGSEQKGADSGYLEFSDSSSISPFHSSNASPVQATNVHCDNISDFEEIEEEENSGFGQNPLYPPHMGGFSNTTMPNYYYMKAGHTVPNTVYQQPIMDNANKVYTDNGYGYNYGYNYPIYGFNLGPEPVQMQNVEANRDSELVPPPPPPVPEVPGWDFFNPFDSYQQFVDNVSFQNVSLSGSGSIKSSPNSSEVREREGIPDLEDETEQEPIIKVNSKKQRKLDAGVTLNETGQKGQGGENQVDNIEISDKNKVEPIRPVEPIKNVKKVNFEMNESLSEDRESGTSEMGESVVLVRTGTRGIEEVVKEIKEEFVSLIHCGDEVTRLLDVGTVQSPSRIRVLRLAISRILGIFLPSTSSQLSNKSCKTKWYCTKEITCTEIVNEVGFNNLSSILERLYLWEKKLYKEVKEEEKLRLMYERKWKTLRALDKSGAEGNKIHSTRMATRDLITRINISLREVQFISRRIHKLRDDELQPLLIELLRGFMKMWRLIFECHHKQFQAISKSKPDKLFIPETRFVKVNSFKNPTIQLGTELLNWSLNFSNWIKAQNSYIQTLNQYLLKWLPEETELETLGMNDAPVFIFSKDWAQLSERVSEMGVINAMNSFAFNVRDLSERQGLERQQKIRSEYLSNDLSKRVEFLNPDLDLEDNGLTGGKMITGLGELKKRVVLEKAKYEEMFKVVQETGLGNLKTGLGMVFEALESFSMEILSGFDGVRVPNSGGVT